MTVELVAAVEPGAVGFFCSGYCSVSRFLNMAVKVTPKPAAGPSSDGLSSDSGISVQLPSDWLAPLFALPLAPFSASSNCCCGAVAWGTRLRRRGTGGSCWPGSGGTG